MNIESEESRANHDTLIQRILSRGGPLDDLLHRPLLEATRRLAAGLSVSDSLRQQVVDAVCRLWLQPPFWQMRDIIEGIWMSTTDAEFAEALAPRLMALAESAAGEERGVGLTRLLSTLGKHEEARSLLLGITRQDYEEYAEENVAAAILLAEMGEVDAAAILLKFATDAELDEWDRHEALQALSQLGEQSGVAQRERLVASVRAVAQDGQTGASVRCTVALTIGALGAREAARTLLRELATSDAAGEKVQRKAAEGLAQFGERAEAISKLRQLAVEERHHAVNNVRAAQALARLGEREAAVSLLMEAGRPDRPCVACGEKSCGMGRRCAVQALRELGEVEKATSMLRDMVQEEGTSAGTRVDALVGLGELGHVHEITPLLLHLMQDQTTFDFVRKQALEALGKWGERSDEVREALLTCARDEHMDQWERRSAIEALGNLGQRHPEVLHSLLEIARTHAEPALAEPPCAPRRVSHYGRWFKKGEQEEGSKTHLQHSARYLKRG